MADAVASSGGAPDAPAPPSGEQIEPKATPETTQAAPAPRRHKITYEGREEELDDAGVVDALKATLGEDGFKNAAQLTRVLRQKLSQAGASERQIRDAAEDLKSPKKMMALMRRIHGPDVTRAEIEEYYSGDLAERQRSPEERKTRERMSDLDRREARIKDAEARERETATSAQAAKLQPQLQTEFARQVEKHGVKMTPIMQSRMAKLVEDEVTSLRDGGQRVSQEDFRQIIADAAHDVASKHFGEIEGDFPNLPAEKRTALIRSSLATMKPSEIAEAIGEQRMREFRRWDLEEARRRRGSPTQLAPQPKPKAPTAPSSGGGRTVDDWLPEKF